MAQGRGNSAMVALMLLFCMLVSHSEIAHANFYFVGDAGGWTFNVVDWPNGKHFMEGDTLVFNYNPGLHNVVIVLNEAGYNACNTSSGDIVHQSGHDQIQLVSGQNYFICSFPGHCQGGMKIAVNAGKYTKI